MKKNLVLSDSVLDLEFLRKLSQKPEPFEPGEPLFWNDEHISKQMLAAHLDPHTDAASRRPEIIDQSIAWICQRMDLPVGAAVLDLGCGPGLYAARLAQRGFQVTGVDYSRRSLEYARGYAAQHHLNIEYRFQDYLDLADENRYDAALLIYGDFCPLSPEPRARLLHNVHRALKPGGFFILDVSTREHRKWRGLRNGWHVLESGFWKPGPHLVLEQGFDYPNESLYLDQYVILEAHGKISVYRNWFQDFSPESITAELETGSFQMKGIWSDLTGAPYQPTSEWIGIVACKA